MQSKLSATQRLLTWMLRLYPRGFRDSVGADFLATYTEYAEEEFDRGGRRALLVFWARAIADSLRNGPAERVSAAIVLWRSRYWRIANASRVIMVGAFSLALGAFGVVYTAVDKVLLADLPYERAEDIYAVWRNYTWLDLNRGALAGTDVIALANSPAIDDAIAVSRHDAAFASARNHSPVPITVFGTTGNFFNFVGVRPHLGRVYSDTESRPSALREIVITHDLWRNLGAERAIIGREVTLNGLPYSLIGVLPPDFEFTRHASPSAAEVAEAFIPLDVDLAATSPRDGSYSVMIKARAGTSAREVGEAVSLVGAAIDKEHLGAAGMQLYAVPAKEDLISRIRPAINVVAVATTFLLFVVVLSMATSLMAGALRSKRVRGLRGLMISIAAGGIAVAVAYWGTAALQQLLPADFPRRANIFMDARIALTIFSATVATGLVVALGAASGRARRTPAFVLERRENRRQRVLDTLGGGIVVVQVALALVLLSTGAVLIRNVRSLTSSAPGFDPRGVLAIEISLAKGEEGIANANHLQSRVHEELKQLPGVIAVGAANALPLASTPNSTTITVPRRATAPLVDNITALPGYFEAMRIPVLAGRTFTKEGNAREIVVDRILAERFFESYGAALGATLLLRGDSLRIIGIVDHSRMTNVYEDGRAQMYRYDDEQRARTLHYVIRTSGDPHDLATSVQRMFSGMDGVSIAHVRSLSDVVNESLEEQRLTALLVAAFSAAASLLAAFGLFGLVRRHVDRREYELAIRVARGARRSRLLLNLIVQGMNIALAGILAGLAGVYLLGPVVRGIVVGVSPHDTKTLLLAVSGLVLLTLGASYFPARRVLRIDPANILRDA